MRVFFALVQWAFEGGVPYGYFASAELAVAEWLSSGERRGDGLEVCEAELLGGFPAAPVWIASHCYGRDGSLTSTIDMRSDHA
jgi:hypothetical protein